MTSSLIVWMRVSTSAVTDALTNASETCWRPTSTVAVARYRLGRDRAMLAIAPATAQNTTKASHRRRRQISSARSRPDERLAREEDRCVTRTSRNQNDVARLQAEIFGAGVLAGQLVVRKRQLTRNTGILTQHDDM